MKKTANLWRRMLVGIALMLTMCLALVGCGGGGGSAESKLIGYWELSGGTLEGEELDDELIQMMKDWDAHMIIHFAEDGKCEVDMFGDVCDATWDAKAKTMDWEGETVEFKLDGDTLSINDGSNHIEFKKGDSTDLASFIETDRSNMTRSGTDSTTDPDVEPAMIPLDPVQTIADDEWITATVDAKYADEYGYVGLVISVRNNSNENVTLYSPSDMNYVDGVEHEAWFSCSLTPGETKTTELSYDGITSVDQLVNITLNLGLYYTESYDDICSYSTVVM